MGSIKVNNLGKAYRVYPSRFARLKEWLHPFGRSYHQLHWVLNDLNFQISAGEAVGIIGVNGAGKSTLLKMLTGTTVPTAGTIEMTGRVAALLELGMGFHPEFTGRQNAFMAGQLLGLSQSEIQQLMPEIEAFAEIGDYLDQPVRVYSSGMQMRLAFAVATARRPDILIVDEALSVGDIAFQHKSFDRIRQLRQQGTTLLIVSHDKQAIQSICDRAILLSGGQVAKVGQPEEIMDYYNAMLAEHSRQTIRQVQLPGGRVQTISGTGEARVENISLLNEKQEQIEIVNVGEQVTLRIEVDVQSDLSRLILGYGIKDRLGQKMFGTNTELKKMPLENLVAGSKYVFRFSFSVNLGPGVYSVQTSLSSSSTHLENNFEWRDQALIFNVINYNRPHFEGCSWIDPLIEIESL